MKEQISYAQYGEALLAKGIFSTITQTLEDPQVIVRVAHTMRPSETLGEWYSRVGMGKAQVLAATPEQITRAVELATLRAQDEVPVPKTFLY